MRRPNLRDPDVADAIRAERRDEAKHHKACFEAAHSVDDDAELERAALAFNAKQLTLIPVVSHVPDPMHSYDIDRVIRAARVDALVDVACRRSCDPRGHFIKRPEFTEGWWLLYRESYNETFDSEVAK